MNLRVLLFGATFALTAQASAAATVLDLGELPAPFSSTVPTSIVGSFVNDTVGNFFGSEAFTGTDCFVAGTCRRSIWEDASDPFEGGSDTASYLVEDGTYSALGAQGTQGMKSEALATWSLGMLIEYIDIVWGSADPHNVIEFYRDGNLVDTITGGTVFSMPGYGISPVSKASIGQEYMRISASEAFDTLVFRTDWVAFEYAMSLPVLPPQPVPVTTSGLLLASGLAFLAGFMRRKSSIFPQLV